MLQFRQRSVIPSVSPPSHDFWWFVIALSVLKLLLHFVHLNVFGLRLLSRIRFIWVHGPPAFRHCFWQYMHVRDISCFVLFVSIACSRLLPLLFSHLSRIYIRLLTVCLHSVLFSVRRLRSIASIPASDIGRRQFCGVFLHLFLCLSTVSIGGIYPWTARFAGQSSLSLITCPKRRRDRLSIFHWTDFFPRKFLMSGMFWLVFCIVLRGACF